MSPRSLTRIYTPNPILAALTSRLFRAIAVDHAWVEQVRELSTQGNIVYVLRSRSFVDFLALDFLTKQHGLPPIRFVNDLGLWLLNPLGKGWTNALNPRTREPPIAELQDAFQHSGSAALFLKRPAAALELATPTAAKRGLNEGDDLIATLIELQRESATPILLIPQVFVWTKYPDQQKVGLLDFFIGSRKWPTSARTLGQLLHNRKHVELRLGAPVHLADWITKAPSAPTPALVRRVTYTLLRRLERERRAVTGPLEKSPERIRQELLRSPRVRKAIGAIAGQQKTSEAALTRRAEKILKNLQATPEGSIIKALAFLFDRVFTRIYAGIEHDPKDIPRLKAAARQGTLVLLPSHKSHMDYLILSYLFNGQNLPLPLIVAGDNLNFFPLGPILRRGGGFFIRRSFKGDRLYSSMVEAYVRRLIRDGYPIELFLEGGRSRVGKLLAPKLGLLSMLVDAALSVSQKPTFFVPVSIGYERLVEANSYERELTGGDKQKEDASGLLKTKDILRHRYGRINLQFGQELTLSGLRAELDLTAQSLNPAKRRALVTRLGNRVMDEINRVTAVTPGSLTAVVLLNHTEGVLTHEALLTQCRRLFAILRGMGARSTPTLVSEKAGLNAKAIVEAVQMFSSADLVQVQTHGDTDQSAPWFTTTPGTSALAQRAPPPITTYRVDASKRLLLDTSKNILIHFFVERALIAIATTRGGLSFPASRDAIKVRVQMLSRLFKYEFRFRADAHFDVIFDEAIDSLATEGILKVGEQAVNLCKVSDNASAAATDAPQWRLEYYAHMLQNFLEAYWIAAKALELLLQGPLSEKELVKRTLALARQLALRGEISCRESINKLLFQNAFRAYVAMSYLTQADGRFELTESYREAETVQKLAQGLADDYLIGSL